MKTAKLIGNYYHIIVKDVPQSKVKQYRTQDVGTPGHLQRLVAKLKDGRWITTSWHLSQQDAYVKNSRLHSQDSGIQQFINKLGGVKVQ